MRVVKLTKVELLEVLKMVLIDVEEDDIIGRLYEIRFAVEPDGLKLKRNQDTWSPPMGTVEP